MASRVTPLGPPSRGVPASRVSMLSIAVMVTVILSPAITDKTSASTVVTTKESASRVREALRKGEWFICGRRRFHADVPGEIERHELQGIFPIVYQRVGLGLDERDLVFTVDVLSASRSPLGTP